MGSTKLTKKQDLITHFLADIKPFFCGRPISYADLGASSGTAFEIVASSELVLNQVLLIEPKKECYAQLKEAVRNHEAIPDLQCLNIAVSNKEDAVQRKKVYVKDPDLSPTTATGNSEASTQQQTLSLDVKSKPIDDLIAFFPGSHVSIVKIDVKGREAAVLRGAEEALSKSRIDVVYIETTLILDKFDQTDIQHIVDIMTSNDYSLLKLYEQENDWDSGDPILRYVNLAFISQKMIERFPLSLMQDLANLREDLREARNTIELIKDHYEKSLQDRFLEIAQLTELTLGKCAPLHMPKQPVVLPENHFKSINLNSRSRGKLEMVLGMKQKHFHALVCILLYVLGVATPLVF